MGILYKIASFGVGLYSLYLATAKDIFADSKAKKPVKQTAAIEQAFGELEDCSSEPAKSEKKKEAEEENKTPENRADEKVRDLEAGLNDDVMNIAGEIPRGKPKRGEYAGFEEYFALHEQIGEILPGRDNIKKLAGEIRKLESKNGAKVIEAYLSSNGYDGKRLGRYEAFALFTLKEYFGSSWSGIVENMNSGLRGEYLRAEKEAQKPKKQKGF